MVRFALAATSLVWLSGASAFTVVPHSSFVARSTIPQYASSSTALQMNLFDRFTRVAKSNLNNILKTLEDPEKILNQAVEDMQNDLVKVRQSYAEVTATQRRLLKQKEQCDSVAADWYNRAQLALKAGNEMLAKEALTRRQVQVDESANLQAQIDAQASNIDKLYEGMQVLERSILEARAKKEQMVARARTAQTTQKVNDMLSGITGNTSMDAFKRMEDKVEALEAAAEVSAEMGSVGGRALPGSAAGSLEQQFRLLEAQTSVDAELNKLKGLLNPAAGSTNGSSVGESTSSSSSSSSNTASSAASNAAVDDELAKLKREAGL